jgi:hypothetical protein
MRNVTNVVVALVLTSPAALAQTTLHVPAAFATIQAAIVAAGGGATVLVAPGIYSERLDFLGKAITVRAANGPAATTIDGNQGGPVVTFVSGEGPASVLEGFTIRNGRGATIAPPGVSQGGGIHCSGASPTIRGCVITANFGGSGAAMILVPGSAGGPGGVLARNSALRLIDCVVQGNFGGPGGQATGVTSALTATGGAGGAGGIAMATVYLAAQPLLHRCRIEGNTGGAGGTAFNAFGYATGGSGGAGGIELVAAGPVVCDTCALLANQGGAAAFGSGAVGSGNANGGAGGFIGSASSPPGALRMQGCVVVGNQGGIRRWRASAAPVPAASPSCSRSSWRVPRSRAMCRARRRRSRASTSTVRVARCATASCGATCPSTCA